MDEEVERKLRLKIFKCSFRISYIQIIILQRALDLYSKHSKTYQQETIMLKKEILNNTRLKRKYQENEEI